MPVSRKACGNKQCPLPAIEGYRFCSEHLKENRQGRDAAKEPERLRVYSSQRWQAIRRVVLGRDPLCVLCLQEGIVRASEVVDHIQSMQDGGAQFDLENLQGLCVICHNRKSQLEANARRNSKQTIQ